MPKVHPKGTNWFLGVLSFVPFWSFISTVLLGDIVRVLLVPLVSILAPITKPLSWPLAPCPEDEVSSAKALLIPHIGFQPDLHDAHFPNQLVFHCFDGRK